MKQVFTIFLTFLLLPSLIYSSSPTDLDTTFNNTGYNTKLLASNYKDATTTTIAKQSSSKIITAGTTTTITDNSTVCILYRYTQDGTIDDSFGANGITITEIGDHVSIHKIAIITESGSNKDKIIVVGSSITDSVEQALLMRYTEDGKLDTSFGTNGIITFTLSSADFNPTINIAYDVAIDEDNKIVICGKTQDTTRTDISSLAFVTRYNSHGDLDTTFNNGGYINLGYGYNCSAVALALQSDGHINLLLNYSNAISDTTYNTTIMRLNNSGTISSTTFYSISTNSTTNIIGYDLFLDSNEQCIATGTYTDSSNIQQSIVIRWNTNGTLDTTFGDINSNDLTKKIGYTTFYLEDHTDLTPTSILTQNDNFIITGTVTSNNTQQSLIIIRYKSNGSLDTSFHATGYTIRSIPNYQLTAHTSILQENDLLLIAGQFTNNNLTKGTFVLRYTIALEGIIALDPSFNYQGYNLFDSIAPASFLNNTAYKIAHQSTGKTVIVSTLEINNNSDIYLFRYNADGTLDTSFGNNNTGYITLTELAKATGSDTTLINSNSYSSAIAIDNNDNIAVIGTYKYSPSINEGNGILVFKVNQNGNKLDTNFISSQNTIGYLIEYTEESDTDNEYNDARGYDINVGADNKIYAAGSVFLAESYHYETVDQGYFPPYTTTTKHETYATYNTIGVLLVYNPDGTLFGKEELDLGYKKTGHDVDKLADDEMFENCALNKIKLQSNNSIVATLVSRANISVDKTIYTPLDLQIILFEIDSDIDSGFELPVSIKDTTTLSQFPDSSIGVDLTMQHDDKTIGIANYNNSEVWMARCNSNGSIDETFGDNGYTSFTINNIDNQESISHLQATKVHILYDNQIMITGFITTTDDITQKIFIYFDSFGLLNDYTIETITTQGSNNIDSAIQSDLRTINVIGTNFDSSKIEISQFNSHNPNEETTYLDNSFNYYHGYNTTTPNTPTISQSNSVAQQSDGKLISVGQTEGLIIITRHNTNGTLDTTFGTNGYITTLIGIESGANAVAIQSDNKIVIAGYTVNDSNQNNLLVARYTSNGAIDTSFNNGSGYAISLAYATDSRVQAHAVHVRSSDGKITIAGTRYASGDNDLIIIRYNSNGSLDTSFDNDGIQIVDDGGKDLAGVAIGQYLTDKTAVLYSRASSNYTGTAIFAMDNDGSSANQFDDNGKKNFDMSNTDHTVPTDLIVDANGKLLMVGSYYNNSNTNNSKIFLKRCDYKGSMDSGFGSSGTATFTLSNSSRLTAASVNLYSDGKIAVTGRVYYDNKDQVIIIRFNSNGTLDTSLNGTGYILQSLGSALYAYDSFIDTNKNIIVSGKYNNDMFISRFTYNGALDTTFDTDGYNTFVYDNTSSTIYAVTQQSNGKIVAAGTTNDSILLTRYNTDGSLDTTFGTNGNTKTIIGIECGAHAVAIQADDKIVIAGYTKNSSNEYNIFTARYTKDGFLDSSFNGSGYAISLAYESSSSVNAYAVHVRSSDGKVITTGSRYASNDNDLIIIRYNSNGSLDTSFDGDGIQILNDDGKDLTGVAIGQYLTDKTAVLYARVSSNYTGTSIFAMDNDGSSANQFDDNGKKNFDMSGADHTVPADLIVDANGKLLMVGSYYNNSNPNDSKIFLKRCDYNGSMDSKFGSNGTATFALNNSSKLTATSVNLYSDGTIAITGHVNYNNKEQIIIIRFNKNGILDTPFNNTGYSIKEFDNNTIANDSIITNDNSIIIAGQYNNKDLFICRFIGSLQSNNEIAELDETFDNDGYNTTTIEDTNTNNAYAVALQSDGRIITTGKATIPSNVILLTRYTIDGILDFSFGLEGSVTTTIGNSVYATAIAITNDDKIIVVGSTTINSIEKAVIARYTKDGMLDENFGTSGIVIDDFINIAYGVDVSPDNKIIIGGVSGLYGVVTRYNSNGSIDETFGLSGYITFESEAEAIEVYNVVSQTSDETIIITTNYTNIDNNTSFAKLIKILSNGDIDHTFNADATNQTISIKDQTHARDLIIQDDGKFIVTGITNDINTSNQTEIFTTRRNNNGTIDTTFGTNGYSILSIDGSENLTPTKLNLQYDNKIVVTGNSIINNIPYIIFMRYLNDGYNDGALDTTFSSTGYITTTITDINFMTNDSLIDESHKWLLTGQYNNTGILTSRYIGNYEEIQQSDTVSTTSSSDTTLTTYGTNPDNLEQLLPIEFIANTIFNQNEQNTRLVSTVFTATTNAITNILNAYKEKFKNIPNFNYLKNLNTLQLSLNNAEKSLMEEFPERKLLITKFFNKIRLLINRLTRSILLPI